MANARTRQRLTSLLAVAIVVIGAAVPFLSRAQSPAAEPTEDKLIQRGAEIYTTVCIACHQADGKGVPGIYLPLADNKLIAGENPDYFITTVLNGRGGMPAFKDIFSDEEIAAVTTYVRTSYGNTGAPVSPQRVKEIRAQYWGTPVVSPTPEGQRTGGNVREGHLSTPTVGTPEASPAATP